MVRKSSTLRLIREMYYQMSEVYISGPDEWTGMEL